MCPTIGVKRVGIVSKERDQMLERVGKEKSKVTLERGRKGERI